MNQPSFNCWIAIDATLSRKIAIAFSILIVAVAYYLLVSMPLYGYDEVVYYSNFTFKLTAEGRWIDFLLHSLLQKFPLPVCAVLYVVLAWSLLRIFMTHLTSSQTLAMLGASAVLVSPPFVEQSLWPASLMPTLAASLFLCWLAHKKIHFAYVYIVAGVLLFGCMQNYYFLIPLLYADGEGVHGSDSRKLAIKVVSHLSFWILGALVGTGVALVAVYIITGQVGIVPAAWRHVMPVHDLSSLLRNIETVGSSFVHHFGAFFVSATSRNKTFYALLLMVLVSRVRDWRLEYGRFLILVLVALGFFAFSIPLAPVIQERSLVALAAAVVALLFVPAVAPKNGFMLAVCMALLVLIGMNMAVSGHKHLATERSRTGFLITRLRAILPRAAADYSAIAVFGHMNPDDVEAPMANNAAYMHAIVMAAGTSRYIDCATATAECKGIANALPSAPNFDSDGLRFIGHVGNIAVVSIGRASPTPAATIVVVPVHGRGCQPGIRMTADVTWSSSLPSGTRLDVLVTAPKGLSAKLFASGGPTGHARTGDWLEPGTRFTLIDANGARSLATRTVRTIRCTP